jgi:hypothetical protein
MAETPTQTPPAQDPPANEGLPVTMQLTAEQLAAIPKKFIGADGTPDVAKMAGSYGESEKALAAAQATAAASAAAQPDPNDPLAIPVGGNSAVAADMTVDQSLQAAGYTMEQLIEEAAGNNGTLKPETYTDINTKIGWNRGIVDFGLRGGAALRAQEQMEVDNALNSGRLAAVGGDTTVPEAQQQAALANLLAFAGTAFTPAELDGPTGIRAQLKDPASTVMAVNTIRTRHQQALGAGNVQPLVTAGVASPGTGLSITKENIQQVRAQARTQGPSGDQARSALASGMRDGSLAKAAGV